MMNKLRWASAAAGLIAVVGAAYWLSGTPWNAEAGTGGGPNCRVIETRDVPPPSHDDIDRLDATDEQKQYIREQLDSGALDEYLVATEVSEICED